MINIRHYGLLALLLGIFATSQAPARSKANPTNDWRKVATPADKARLMRWRTTLVNALAEVRRDGATELLTNEAALVAPDAALARPAIPAGNYLCRTIKLGRKGAHTAPGSARPALRCTISDRGGLLWLSASGGAQRPRGTLYPGNEWRQIFLGTLSLGDETRGMDYGRDADRDMAGLLERIGERRWRIILPEPAFESSVDIIELTPAN